MKLSQSLKTLENLESSIREAKDDREVAVAALSLAEALWEVSGPKERIRIIKYAQMAAESFLRSQMSFQAVWVLVWLREATSLWEESITLEQLLSGALSRKQPKKRKTADENLPVPTPFQEFSARISTEGFSGSEIVRDQLKNLPQSISPLFSILKVGEVARLLRTADCVRLKAGDVLFRQGEKPNGFYVLCSGGMVLESSWGEKRSITPTDFLGDIALFAELNHSSTSTAVEDSRLIYFAEDKLRDPFRSIPRLKEELHDLFHRRLFLSVAHESLIFRHLHAVEIERCWDYFVPIHVSSGQVLMEPRMSPERFFMVLKGKLEVTRPGKRAVVLGPGHFVGERGLILEKARTAQVKTLSECDLLECDRWSYMELRAEFPEAAEKIDRSKPEYEKYQFNSHNLVID